MGSEMAARWGAKTRILGRVSQMTKAQPQSELAALVSPVNSKRSVTSERRSFGEFVQDVYLPFYRRKRKALSFSVVEHLR